MRYHSLVLYALNLIFLYLVTTKLLLQLAMKNYKLFVYNAKQITNFVLHDNYIDRVISIVVLGSCYATNQIRNRKP